MPKPALLSAAKLARGQARDVEDVAWRMKELGLGLADIRTAIDSLPDATQRETARDNIVFVELVVASQRGPE